LNRAGGTPLAVSLFTSQPLDALVGTVQVHVPKEHKTDTSRGRKKRVEKRQRMGIIEGMRKEMGWRKN